MKIIYHPLTALFLTLLALVFLFSLRSTTADIQQSRTKLVILREEVESIREAVARKEFEFQDAQSDFRKEQIIRDELLLQEPGDIVLQLPRFSNELPAEERAEEDLAPWQAWWRLVRR